VAAPTDRSLWLVTLERAPRVLEQFRAPLAGEPKVALSLHERDLDADGHADLLLAIEVTPAGLPMTRVEAHFLNRAGGLAQQPGEPETALLALADDAKAERKKRPEQAAQLAGRVLAVHGALCRESPTARLVLGDAPGMPCGASLAAGRAASIATAVRAARGELVAALDQYASLSSPIYRLTENDWDRARSAIMAKAEVGSLEWRAGPAPDPKAGALVRRSSIAFVDERQLLLRGATARTYELATGAVAPSGVPGDTRVVDPTGQLAISAIVRSCEGFHLQVVQASQVVAGVVAGPVLAEPLIAAAQPPAGATCPALDAALRKDSGGFQVIDWSAQGVLLARRENAYLLRLDAAGKATAPAEPLAPGPAAAALTSHSAQLTADGKYLAFATSLGIALLDRASNRARLVALPSGPTAGLPVADVAISPSGRRMAFVRGGELWIGSPPEPPAPSL
jgi:hypothetical protein